MITWEGGEEPIRLMLKEGMRHKWRLVLGFVLICSVGVALGLFWPKSYASSVTVSLQQDNVIDTLMEGRAVRTEVAGPPQSAGDMGLGRSLIERALEERGEIGEDTSPRERDRAISTLAGRTELTQPGENLVTLHYRGSDPKTAQQMANRLGELFVEETLQGRERESDAAFQFIDQQAQRYQERMKGLEAEIEQLRAEHPVAEPGAPARLNERESTLSQQISDLEQQIREAQIREDSLQNRLAQVSGSGPGEVGGGGPAQARLAQLRQELETLRLSYHESYPDIVRLKRQIAQLEQQQGEQGGASSAQASAQGDDQGAAPGPGSNMAQADAGTGDPGGAGAQSYGLAGGGLELRQGVQQSLYETQTNTETLESRLQTVRSQLASVHEDQAALEEVQKQISELERSHAINANIHEDLVSRRENARVSRELGSAERGLTMRVEEPANLPTTPELPRPLHFALAGGVLGAGVPIGLLFLVVMLDPRVRDVAHIPVETGSVLLTTIPHARTRTERRLAPLSVFACVMVVLATVAGLAALMWIMGGYGI
ncbi:MAG: hypothetical protein WD382_04130 [Halofilum sp. (in: g-proteobacteria)]